MFYKLIEKKRNIWLNSSDCTVKEFMQYIENKGFMRDTQIEAIKTYLFLKIECNNKPLYKLFAEGNFNTLDVNELEINSSLRDYFLENKEAQALYEYAIIEKDEGNTNLQKLADEIKNNYKKIDYKKIFKQLFYDTTYTDYIFSLPMGAGKTYLMAAFIYIDLYFAINEPNNKNFAHNFMIFAPSGLKSSIVPSLKTIQNFDPEWIIPKPTSDKIKSILKFELLDQNKSANKSNKTKNPNVQKIAIHQPINELIGLVAITNAEKVILDRIKIEKNGQINLLEYSDDEKDRKANELRNIIGKIPNLSIFIDEVHHATDDDIKLRAVINNWITVGSSINSVLGFSGTPYLSKAHNVDISSSLSIKGTELSNVVYYYPLIDGINNFLKQPIVKISDNTNSLEIIENGVKLFLDQYKDKRYKDGTISKLAIYCGKGGYNSPIQFLEEVVYPKVATIVETYNLNASDVILKYHQGSTSDEKVAFETLDKPFSKVRIVLLVQIGKEGWDCKSLTGVILSQKGDCPQNMVLQTSCRCLRQVVKGDKEKALIYLNEFNANTLNKQLEKQHNINIEQFQNGNNKEILELKRYNRIKHLKLPKIDFYQLKVELSSIIIDNACNVKAELEKAMLESKKTIHSIKTQEDFEKGITDIDYEEFKNTIYANYNVWLNEICKESFGNITKDMLKPYEDILKKIFNEITIVNDDNSFVFKGEYDIKVINSNIRKAFYTKRELKTTEEIIPETASLLKLDNFTKTIKTTDESKYYPHSDYVEKIITADKGKVKISKKELELIEDLKETGNENLIERITDKYDVPEEKDRTYHYLPYKTDSIFEQTFFKEVIVFSEVKEKELEVYYNGDRELTEFKIRCFKKVNSKYHYVGMYTPDFLIIKRKDNKIYKAIIVETKGSIYANDKGFQSRKSFMENEFINKNNDKFGYERFSYLYLQDNLKENERIEKTFKAIKEFFKEEK